MQYLRRDKKDEEDGKRFKISSSTFLNEFICNQTFSFGLGSQSNPFQNLDKSAVLQEVTTISFKDIVHLFFVFLDLYYFGDIFSSLECSMAF